MYTLRVQHNILYEVLLICNLRVSAYFNSLILLSTLDAHKTSNFDFSTNFHFIVSKKFFFQINFILSLFLYILINFLSTCPCFKNRAKEIQFVDLIFCFIPFKIPPVNSTKQRRMI